MTDWLEIADPSDPRVEVYRGLRGRDAAIRGGGFVVEGPLALDHALGYGRYPLASALASEAKAERVLAMLAAAGSAMPLYVAAQPVMDEICGFPVHRGVLAYGGAPTLPTVRALLGSATDDAVVCAIGLNDQENVGALFRNAAALGAAAVLLDPTACDPFRRRPIRVSAGAVLSVASARFTREDDILETLHAFHRTPVALSPRGGAPLKTFRSTGPIALLVGAEGPGLPADLLARCQNVCIPMARGVDSLNVATAAAIALHHLQ